MRRLKWFISVALILISGWCIEQASAKAAAPAWMTAYEEILSRWKSQTPEDPDMVQELHYLVYDIDKDGTPEMIVRSGTCEADYHGALYTIRNGQAVQMGEELGLGHCSFYSDPEENGIIMMWAHMGYSSAVRISLTDGYSEELLYEDDLNAKLQENPDADYVYPGDVILGSVYLTLCRADLSLPMTHYEEISRCLEGSLSKSTGGQYPNQDEAFYENLMHSNSEVFAVTADGFTNSPGWIGFQDLLRQDALANWMQGDLNILSVSPVDFNGDGKMECCVSASDGGSEVRIVLSEQDGTVFAYLINYTEGYETDAEGNIVCFSPYYSFRYRLIFDGEQAFLLNLPIV